VESLLGDAGPVGLGVEDPGAIARALGANTVVGEPEATGLVEDEVVGATQRPISARTVKGGHFARREIDPVDAASRIGRRRHQPEDEKTVLAVE
jgi:hypothetical protein